MRVYVAGNWNKRKEIRALMDRLEEMGHTITHDWTSYERTYTSDHARNEDCALRDVEGVVGADLLIALLTEPDYAYRGTSSELGAALACRALRSDRQPAIWIVAPADPEGPTRDLPYCLRTDTS
jgi:nucleoside 2-deoxyribosyltransferase